MIRRKPEGGETHKLTVYFRSWIPQEEEAWKKLVAGANLGFPAAARVREIAVGALATPATSTGAYVQPQKSVLVGRSAMDAYKKDVEDAVRASSDHLPDDEPAYGPPEEGA